MTEEVKKEFDKYYKTTLDNIVVDYLLTTPLPEKMDSIKTN